MVDELSQRLAAYESTVVATLRLTPVEAVRARGARRRAHTFAAALATAVAVLLGGAAVATTGGLGPGRLPVGGPDGLVSAATLADLRLPHEGELGYALRTSVGEPSALQPCTGIADPPVPYAAVADPTRIGRIAARTVAVEPRPGIPDMLASQVLLFTSVDLAGGAVRELADGMSACGWMTSGSGTEYGYDWLGGVRSFDVAPGKKGFESGLVYRAGNVVAVVFSHEIERADAIPGAAAGAAMSELLTRLCVIAACPDRHGPQLFTDFPSLDPQPTHGPSDPPPPAPPYPSPLGTTPAGETPPPDGATPS